MLRDIKDDASIPRGYEISRTYFEDGSFEPGLTSAEGKTRPYVPHDGRKCFIVHNHPDTSHISLADIQKLLESDAIVGVSEVGHDGSVSLVIKETAIHPKSPNWNEVNYIITAKIDEINTLFEDRNLSNEEYAKSALEIVADAIIEAGKYGIYFVSRESKASP